MMASTAIVLTGYQDRGRGSPLSGPKSGKGQDNQGLEREEQNTISERCVDRVKELNAAEPIPDASSFELHYLEETNDHGPSASQDATAISVATNLPEVFGKIKSV